MFFFSFPLFMQIKINIPNRKQNKKKTLLVCMTTRIHVRCPIHWTIYRRMFLDPKELSPDSPCHFRMAAKMRDKSELGKCNNVL